MVCAICATVFRAGLLNFADASRYVAYAVPILKPLKT